MDHILEIILKDEEQQLDGILSEQATKRSPSVLDLTMKHFEEMFVFASYSGSVSCLTILTEYGE